MKGESLNILNAYQDDRFNKEVDLKTNYKTNTILCVPIMEVIGKGNRVLGVIQAINKHNGIFTKDDEGLLMILAQLAAQILRNSMSFDEQLLFHNTLRHCLKTGITLNAYLGFEKLLPQAEKKIKKLMGVEASRIFLVSNKTQELIRVNPENSQLMRFPINCGIAGYAVEKKKTKNIVNAYSNHRFNGQVDIETSMPIICTPIMHPNNKDVLGVLQVVNARGIQGLSSTHKANLNPSDTETLEFFTQQLAQSLINNLIWHSLQKDDAFAFMVDQFDIAYDPEKLQR
eukprot:TRINITY_DN14281_c0_g1_i3.p1 TRINITY_DN14281_c0_g1~~TRINITY_DN14281_c0_g1_i3.p1  ORF type:complete len:286 (-),score=51.29 TRINITY_DN14281_c0_g1_i3:133-990(-)